MGTVPLQRGEGEENILSSPVESEHVDDSEPSTSASGYSSSAAETSTALDNISKQRTSQKLGADTAVF